MVILFNSQLIRIKTDVIYSPLPLPLCLSYDKISLSQDKLITG